MIRSTECVNSVITPICRFVPFDLMLWNVNTQTRGYGLARDCFLVLSDEAAIMALNRGFEGFLSSF